MSDQLTCPECNDPLKCDEEWRITNPARIGREIKPGESLQGEYVHERCAEPDIEQ